MKTIRAIAISLVLLCVMAFACRQAYNRGYHNSDAERSQATLALIDAGWLDSYMNRLDRFTPEGVTIQQSEELSKDYRLHYQKFHDDIEKIPDHVNIRTALGQRLMNLRTPEAFDDELRGHLEFASPGMLSCDELAAKTEAAYVAALDDDFSRLVVWHEEYDSFTRFFFPNGPPPFPSMKQDWMTNIRNEMKSDTRKLSRARFYPLDQLPKKWPISESESKEPLCGYVIITFGPEEMSWTSWPVVQTRYGARLLAWKSKPDWHVDSSPH